MTQVEANAELVRRFFQEVWNAKDIGAVDRYMGPDTIAYGLPDPDAVLRGSDQFSELVSSFCSAFPDLQVTVKDVIAAGDRVAACWHAKGTHAGDALGFPATGRQVEMDGTSIAIIRGGKLAEAWNMMDMGHLFESLRSSSSRL